MIIQITGTNGSGKSTVVRDFMDLCHDVYTDEHDGHILGYKMLLEGVEDPIRVVGPYETPTGGCDNFKTCEEIYNRVRQAAMQAHVIFEGAGHTMNQTRGPAMLQELPAQCPFSVILLTTPLGVCLKSIDERRAAKGRGGLKKTHNVEGNHVRANNYTARMREAGAMVVRTDREGAVAQVIALLK